MLMSYASARGYSITSSARASSVGGMVRPSVIAVLKLITRLYLVACWTGRSAGLAPLSIRPVFISTWRRGLGGVGPYLISSPPSSGLGHRKMAGQRVPAQHFH